MGEANFTGLLGLALKAKHLVPGADQSLRLVKEGKAALVLLDENASNNTKKRLQDACAFRKVNCLMVSPGLLGNACGKAEMMCAAIKKGGFSEQIKYLLTNDQNMIIKPKTAEDKG